MDTVLHCDADQPDTDTISAMPVAQGEVAGFLFRHLHEEWLRFEQSAFHILGVASDDYQGGLWDFYELSNGGFYMAPSQAGTLRVECAGNGFSGDLSADAAGLYACAMALSHLSFRTDSPLPARKFHLLRAFYLQHAEAARLIRALD